MEKKVYFNSFKEEYKYPFGAVKKGVEVVFSMKVSEQLNEDYINLHIVYDGLWNHESIIKMNKTNGFYKSMFIPQKAGLFFYYFEICNKNQIFFYGSKGGGLGGEGISYENKEHLHMYQLTVFSIQNTVPNWYKTGIAYQIFVDRFFNGNESGKISNPKNNSFIYGKKTDSPMYIKSPKGKIIRWDFFGGNLKGIEKKIPYLKKLGINIIYLTPIFESESNHRYDTGDFFKIDPILGSLQDFDNLVLTIHANEMHLILDGVFSHVGANSIYFNANGRYKSLGAFQSKDSKYYSWFAFKEFPNTYDCWWGIKSMPTVDKGNMEYRRFIYESSDSVVSYWTKRGVDGWRLDVADELPDSFIQGIRKLLDSFHNKVLIGEVWEDASNKISYGNRKNYVSGDSLQSVMNYPLRKMIIDLINHNISNYEWVSKFLTLKENYPTFFFRSTFNNLGSHDTERIFTLLNQNTNKFRLAMGIMMTLPGIPCIYYGDELKMEGGKDPLNRGYFQWNKLDDSELNYLKDIIAWRKKHLWINDANIIPFVIDDIGVGYIYSYKKKFAIIIINNTNIEIKIQSKDIFFLSAKKDFFKKVLKKIEGKKLSKYDILSIDISNY